MACPVCKEKKTKFSIKVKDYEYLDKKRAKKILFIDVKDSISKHQETLSSKEIKRVVFVYEKFKTRSKREYIAELEEIQSNDFDLSPNRYLGGVGKEIAQFLKSCCKTEPGGNMTPLHLSAEESDASCVFSRKKLFFLEAAK